MEDRRPLAPEGDEEERGGEEQQSTLQLAATSSLEGEDLPEVHLHLGGEGDYGEGDGYERKWQHDRQTAEPSTSMASDQRSPLDREEGDDDDDEYGGDDGLVFEGNKLGDAKGGRKLTNLQMCGLSLFWFARSAWWAAFTIILLPLQMLAIVGDEYKGTAVGVITLTGAGLSLLVYPIIGILSDRTQVKKHHRFLPVGRRIMVGVPLMAVTILAFPFLEHRGAVWLVPYAAVYLAIQLFDALSSGPYLALVPDIVSQAQFGAASGWLGLMNMLGNLFGGGILGIALSEITNYGAFLALAIAQIACFIGTMLSVEERPDIIDIASFDPDGDLSTVASPSRRLLHLLDWIREALRPFKDSNFRWVFWTRFLFTAGFQVITQFLQFFMRDAVPRPFEFLGLSLDDPEAAVSFFVGMVTLGSVVSALLSGYVSDRYGRKAVVYVAGTMMAVIPLILIITTNFTVMILSGLIFGLAYGSYITTTIRVDFALASDVLPRSESHATDLGVWHMSWVLPTMITPPIAGLMIDLLDPLSDSVHLSHLGYKSIFVLSSLLLLAAVALVRQIRVSNVEVLGESGEGGEGQEMRTLAASHNRAISS